MTHLVQPFRHPAPSVGGDAPEFNIPLYRPGDNNDYYAKAIDLDDYMKESPTSGIADNRKFSFTLAFRCTKDPAGWPRSFEFTRNDWQDATIMANWSQTTGANGWPILKTAAKTVLASFSGEAQTRSGISDWLDGTLYRIAISVDLDDLVNSWLAINGTKYTDLSAVSVTADNIAWSQIRYLGIGCSPVGGGSALEVSANNDGYAMLSVNNNNDLDFDKVYDGSGYFTNPGKHWLNWYSARPMVAFTTGWYVNQGWLHYLNGRNFHHNPPETWDYTSTSENRHTYYLAPNVGGWVNEGIGY